MYQKENLQDPEITKASVRTTTTFLPFNNCFATIEAKRPKRCPLPSTTTTSAIFSELLLSLFSRLMSVYYFVATNCSANN